MKWLALFIFLPLVVFLWTIGIWEVSLSGIALATFGLAANSIGLLPTTRLYEQRCALKESQWALEKDRIERSRSRLRALESEDLNKMLALPSAKEE